MACIPDEPASFHCAASSPSIFAAHAPNFQGDQAPVCVLPSAAHKTTNAPRARCLANAKDGVLVAQYKAIRAVGESVLEMMREACPTTDLQLGPSPKFELASLGSLTDPLSPPADGFYLVLWRVGIGGMPRNLPPRRHRDGRLLKPSLPLDLYFLLLPVAASADKQTQMLGWALSFMQQLPALTGETINRYTKGSPAIFEPEESVELIADPLGTADYLSLWDRVKSGFQAGMTYVARMVLIDSDQLQPQGALVTERRFGLQAPTGA